MDEYWRQTPSKGEPNVHISQFFPYVVNGKILTSIIGDASSARKAGKRFKPTIHRTVPIILLIAIALSFIGLIEYSLRVLPHHNSSSQHQSRQIQKRQDETEPDYVDQTSANDDPYSDYIEPNSDTTTSDSSSSVAFDASSALYLKPTIQTFAINDSPNTNAPVPTTTPAPDQQAGSPSQHVPQPSATPSPTPMPPPSNTNPTAVDPMTATPTVEAPVADSPAIAIPTSTTPNADVPSVQTQGQSSNNVNNVAFVSSSTSDPGNNPQGQSSPSTSQLEISMPLAQSSPSVDMRTSQLKSGTVVSLYTSIASKQGARSTFVGTTTMKVGSMITTSPGISSSTTSTASKPSGIGSLMESDVPLAFVQKPANYFFAVYFPVLLAVLFRMCIGYLYTATKMMEPFSMLSRSDGAHAKDFLWINYLSANDTFAPFQAMLSGHWLMLWTSILYTAVQLLSPLGAEMFGIYPSYHKINDKTAVGGAGTSYTGHIRT